MIRSGETERSLQADITTHLILLFLGASFWAFPLRVLCYFAHNWKDLSGNTETHLYSVSVKVWMIMTQTNHTDVVSLWITRETCDSVWLMCHVLLIMSTFLHRLFNIFLSENDAIDESMREAMLRENSLCCRKPALHLKPSTLQNVMVCGGNWDLWIAATQTSVEFASRRLRVFVFERPSWIFALVHHDGRNPIVCRHLTAVELRHETETHSMNEWMNKWMNVSADRSE